MDATINLDQWLVDNAARLRPPVGNAQLFEGKDLIVTVVAGPNHRRDFHVDPYEECFFQIRGDIALRIQDAGRCRDVAIKEGDMFLLPAGVPHSPQRPAGSLGMIIERPRGDVSEAFEWYCNACNSLLHREDCTITSFDQLPAIFARYAGRSELHHCSRCGVASPP